MQGQHDGRAPERGGRVGARVAAGPGQQRQGVGDRQPQRGDAGAGAVRAGDVEVAGVLPGAGFGQVVAVEGDGRRAGRVGWFEDDRAAFETGVQSSPSATQV
ncbi:hypothetical protein AB0I60_22045 [Actinosynnema sp. NPDC050436]|uniref:hypothetical protein n=1 Tax=Actinosynnema sp. NPDC050436 TaxID=3155659 RepID=UPI0033CE6414